MEREQVVYEVDGKIVADVRTAEELASVISLYPGWAAVEKVKLSEKSRGGIIMPDADSKDQQHLMLFRIAKVGAKKDDGGEDEEARHKEGDIIVLKPSVAQYLVQQRHQFGIIKDSDIIGKLDVDLLTEKRESDDADEVAVAGSVSDESAAGISSEPDEGDGLKEAPLSCQPE